MTLKDLLQEINDEVKTIVASDFTLEVTKTTIVPNVDDPGLTFTNFDTKSKKCKSIETCVLFIDIRKSTELNLYHKPRTLGKLYTAFLRSMIRASGYFGGYVRGIVGDRVMVVFDTESCFKNAVSTAILLNTIAKHIIDEQFPHNEIRCGIGIDYGKMLVVKTGTVKQGKENQSYKSLVWLGRPANVASKLTDTANKTNSYTRPIVQVGLHYPLTDKWSWVDTEISAFLDDLVPTYSNATLKHKNEYFCAFVKSTATSTNSYRPILMTQSVYDGYVEQAPTDNSVVNGWWHKRALSISGYSGNVYEGDIYYTAVDDID